jgi:endonuclease G, mitochondrial
MTAFSTAEIQQLWQAMVGANVGGAVWKAALQPLMSLFRTNLPPSDTAAGLFEVLNILNATPRLVDGTIPIEVVLGNLRLLSPDAHVSELAARMLARLQGESGLGRGGGPPVGYTAPTDEAYTGSSDDTLPFDFLRGGHQAGRSVVKLVVPRFEGGQPAIGANGQQRRYSGTGWLIAPELIITNLHVICARETGEGDPDPADLELQVTGTEVQLDYDRDQAVPATTTVTGLAARGQRGGARDYAILRVVRRDAWPAPLALRRQPPSIPPEGYAVNIIQHPAGMPKRVAARSNLLRPSTDHELQYFSDTLGGSSGSPLCNDAWEVIGLHRASGPAANVVVKGKPASTYNLGVPIDAILLDLQATSPAVLGEIAPSILP